MPRYNIEIETSVPIPNLDKATAVVELQTYDAHGRISGRLKYTADAPISEIEDAPEFEPDVLHDDVDDE